ncbi:hypothetical protein GGS23DRAFT_585655 [Durotheca rogersii]|uniref:uncharacterized protein n=1 Tax=Durotheca rogersii TaxID=419775 RepID=UPI00221FDA0C|nr:uncharacterized protein GGS23DRAFT_585655 [Durotheca rogersii]KAI5859493.1 hypothetical protein GGS23DRAFT_585655 [Durotheca rogersii]
MKGRQPSILTMPRDRPAMMSWTSSLTNCRTSCGTRLGEGEQSSKAVHVEVLGPFCRMVGRRTGLRILCWFVLAVIMYNRFLGYVLVMRDDALRTTSLCLQAPVDDFESVRGRPKSGLRPRRPDRASVAGDRPRGVAPFRSLFVCLIRPLRTTTNSRQRPLPSARQSFSLAR